MADNSPKAVVLKMIELYNDGTPESYGSDRFLEMFADDCIIDFPASPAGPARRGGKEVFREGLAAVAPIWRNRHTTTKEVVVDGDRVVARNTLTATVAVEMEGFPAGSTLRNDYVDFCTVREGLIVAVVGPVLLDESASCATGSARQ